MSLVSKLLNNSYKKCFEERKSEGWDMPNNACEGAVGGDSMTEHLSYKCIDCPYLDGSEVRE